MGALRSIIAYSNYIHLLRQCPGVVDKISVGRSDDNSVDFPQGPADQFVSTTNNLRDHWPISLRAKS
jgi:hypothetical protein